LVVVPVWVDRLLVRVIIPSDHLPQIDQQRPGPVEWPAHQGQIPAACQLPAVPDPVDPVDPARQIVAVPAGVALVGLVDSVRQSVVVPAGVARVAHHLLQVARAVLVDPVVPVDPVVLVVEVVLVLVPGAVAPRQVHLVVLVVDLHVGESPSAPSARNSTTWKHHRWVVSGCLVEMAMLYDCLGVRA
jgi:hypothetical protein